MNDTFKGSGFLPLPSFNCGLYVFCLLAPVFFLIPWDLNVAQGFFFVLGTFILMSLSCGCYGFRNIGIEYLPIIVVLSFIGLAIHSFDFSFVDNYMASFLNFSMMCEGFIYVLCGCLIIHLVAKYSDNFNLAYPLLVLNIVNCIMVFLQKAGIYLIFTKGIMQPTQQNFAGFMGTKSQLCVLSAISLPILWKQNKFLVGFPILCMIMSGSNTGIVAAYIGIGIYHVVKKNWQGLIIWLVIGISVFSYVDWDRFSIRPVLWEETIQEIVEAPIFGHGFDNSMQNNKIFIDFRGNQEFDYRHNDYLNIARDKGLIFLLVVVVSMTRLFFYSEKNEIWCAAMILAIACFAQTTFYWPRIASIGCVLIGLMEIKNGKRLACLR